MLYEDILSRFQNVVKLKQGGQKTVYTADDAEHGRVVVKVGTATSDPGLDRVRQEAALLRRISSFYYPRNYHFEILPGRRFLIVEELINGLPLSRHYPDFADERAALQLLQHLVRGLQVLWRMQIAHCDVKPSNILIIADKTPIIIDLGIAKVLPQPPPEPLRQCTPSYASPEQLRNQKAWVDYRTDQFSLGIVFLQLLLSGRHPFSPRLVGGYSIRNNILADNWYRKALSSFKNPAISPLLRRLLARQPKQRYLVPAYLTKVIRQALASYEQGPTP